MFEAEIAALIDLSFLGKVASGEHQQAVGGGGVWSDTMLTAFCVKLVL